MSCVVCEPKSRMIIFCCIYSWFSDVLECAKLGKSTQRAKLCPILLLPVWQSRHWPARLPLRARRSAVHGLRPRTSAPDTGLRRVATGLSPLLTGLSPVPPPMRQVRPEREGSPKEPHTPAARQAGPPAGLSGRPHPEETWQADRTMRTAGLRLLIFLYVICAFGKK